VKTAVEVEIEKMLRKGERWNVIAKTLHVSKRTILKVSKRLNEKTSTISASDVFTMFKQDKPPEDIVTEHNADPATIRQWLDDWLYVNETWRKYQEAKGKHG